MTEPETLDELRAAAVRIVTSAARLLTTTGQQYDIAEFIAVVVSSAAANLGGPDELLDGRPGSWEADYTRSLIEGTIGWDPLRWPHYRTEPIKVTLNVAELIEWSDYHPGLLGLDAAGDEVCGAAIAEVDPGPSADARIDELLDHLEQRYADEYHAYGDRFRSAVSTIAEAMELPGVQIELDVDPVSVWWEDSAVRNPDPWGDPIVDELWQRAHDAVALPNVDARALGAERDASASNGAA